MRTVRHIAFLLLLSASVLACSDIEGDTLESMQQDFDKIRLDHVLIISDLICEFKEKTGRFPFEGMSEKPIVVTIASDVQVKNDDGRAPLFVDLKTRAKNGVVPEQPKSIKGVTFQEFKVELEEGLKRSVEIPIDPQTVPVNKPSMYFYTYYLDVYDVTAFLHNGFSFTRQLGQYSHKITVGSRPYPSSSIWTRDDLIGQDDFKRFFKSAFNREGYTLKTQINNRKS